MNIIQIKNSQFEILKQFATKHVLKLAKSRLLEGTRFFQNHKLLPAYKRADVKLALLLVLVAQPDAAICADEVKLLDRRSQKKETLSKRDQ